jgi:subtilisin family serine protease
MDPLRLTGLEYLMNISNGNPDIVIGVIDGPIDITHPAFHGSKIELVHSKIVDCKNANDMACVHGTFITGIISAKRGSSAPAICPGCKIILNPIFKQNRNNDLKGKDTLLPSTTPGEVAKAIIETIDMGAKIINLSMSLSTFSLTSYDDLRESYDYALQNGVIIVVAAGNQGNIGNNSLINHQWPIPVAACDGNGRLDSISNFGYSIGNRGLMAPGVNIKSAYPRGQYVQMSGTSFAAPFVTGAIALLWSIFTKATAAEIILSLTRDKLSRRPSIIPRMLNVEETYKVLKNTSK